MCVSVFAGCSAGGPWLLSVVSGVRGSLLYTFAACSIGALWASGGHSGSPFW